jgi:hypothetical protein
LPFDFVVFLELDFFEPPEDFLPPFFIAMALVPPFWLQNLRVIKFPVNVFFQLLSLFSQDERDSAGGSGEVGRPGGGEVTERRR